MKQKKSNLTILAVLTTLTLLTWVAIEAYQRFRTVDYGNISEQVLAPLSPNLDKKVLDLIEGRKSFTDDEISNFVPQSSGSAALPSPIPTPSPSTSEASVSAQGQF